MLHSCFFNSVNKDRRYKAEMWAEYFKSFIGNGVFPLPSTGMQVVAGEGMTIKIRPGKLWINGYFAWNDADYEIELDIADGALKRIDRIVARWDLQQREIVFAVKKGVFASSPVVQGIQRDDDAYELVLADIDIGAGITAISQATITDRRLNTSLCGLVVGTVTELDTEAFSAQLDAWFADLKESMNVGSEELSEWIYLFKKEMEDALYTISDSFYIDTENYKHQYRVDFENWLESLRDITTPPDTAAQLALAIQELKDNPITVNHNFNDVSGRRGMEILTMPQEDGSLLEIIRIKETSEIIAERETIQKEDGSVIEKTKFYSYEYREGMHPDTYRIRTLAYEQTVRTYLNEDGVPVEEVY